MRQIDDDYDDDASWFDMPNGADRWDIMGCWPWLLIVVVTLATLALLAWANHR